MALCKEDLAQGLSAIHLQRHRRLFTDAEIIRCIEALDRKRQRGAINGFRGNQYAKPEVVKASKEAISKSAQDTAQLVGISPRKVERARTVLEHAEEEVKEAVKAGEMSLPGPPFSIAPLASPAPRWSSGNGPLPAPWSFTPPSLPARKAKPGDAALPGG